MGRSAAYDARITAARRDIADIALADRLFAPHYARAEPWLCGNVATMVHGAPSATAVTQLLPGERFFVLDISGGWAWGYGAHDGYVGYVAAAALVHDGGDATHLVTARTAPVFASADIKSMVVRWLPIGSRIAAVAQNDFVAIAGQGFVHLRHVAAIDVPATDAVTVACDFLWLPYLWGGRGGGGIDCSGLVQQALARTGIVAPRDSDQQRVALGTELPPGEVLRRGDILFFPGHVGLMIDADQLIHANAHWMAVTVEPLVDVVARLASLHEQPILARRRLP